jgi:hypothetical protein
MKMIIIILSLLSFSAFAEDIRFKCDFTDVTYVPQFAISGSVSNEDNSFFNGHFQFTLRKAGRDQKLETLSVTRDGVVQIFEAGTHYRHEIKRLMSVVKGAEVEYINILIDVPPLHTSQIRFLDGTTYFGTCKSF